MARDYYEMLGVDRNASAEELQRAYRTLARRYHPDVNHDPDAELTFKEINEAYHVLSDPDTRSRYDRFGPDFRQIPDEYAEAASRAGRGGSYRSGRSSGSGSGSRRGARVRRGAGSAAGGGINIEDLFSGINIEDLFSGGVGGVSGFEDLFGSWRSAGSADASIPGADQEAELELSVTEAYAGGKRRVTLSGPDGPRSYEVTIPPGVTDAQRIRLSGQGGQGNGGGPSGDLYLRVRIRPDARFRVEGRDIYADAPVAPWEAALGATVPVATPGGEVKVRVPARSSSGRLLRLAGEGMPNPRGKPGDLYAEIRIVVPPRLRKRERELFEELSRESKFDPRSLSR
jgi:curved DNA-binding protein